MPDESDLGANAEATTGLEALVTRRSDADMQSDLGGWTVAAAPSQFAVGDGRRRATSFPD
ncbi:MAG TPA: hypothetical protein VNN21_00530 [Dehalococcoidia bacterium]|nr:hypothetical protein [Dehalococcoidia bacterium]